MENIDATIIPIIKSLGCALPGNVKSIAEFGSDHIYVASSCVLRGINPNHEFPPTLPNSKAAKFRACTAVASAIEELGYTQELGYQAFLYPNVQDMRKLLMWLVDKLPKVDDTQEAEEVVGAGASTGQAIREALKDWTNQQWTPFAVAPGGLCGPVSTVALHVPAAAAAGAPERLHYWKAFQPLVSAQPEQRRLLAPSLFEHNLHALVLAQEREKAWDEQGAKSKEKRTAALTGLVSEAFQSNMRRRKSQTKTATELAAQYMSAYRRGSLDGLDDKGESSAFTRRTDFGQEGAASTVEVVEASGALTVVAAEKVTPQGETEEEKEAKENEARAEREAQIEALRSELKKLKDGRLQLESTAEEHTSNARQMEGQLRQMQDKTEDMEKAYKVKKRTLDLLPEGAANVKKLQEIADGSAKRLIALAAQWEERRVPLVAKYRRKKQLLADRKSEVGAKVDQIKRMRQEMKDKARDLKEKDALYKQVLDELNKMPKSINRQVYVRRIMDIVKNLQMQKKGITEVLEDVHQVQKDINMLSATSKRSFDVVDEVVYSVAKGKKDATAITTYKYVVQLRDGFEELIQHVGDTGKVKNEIRDINSRVDALETRNSDQNYAQISEDLSQVKDENKKLASQIKKKRG